MADYIKASFTDGGAPKTGLTPTVSVWDMSDGSKDLDGVSMSEIGSSAGYLYDISSLDFSKSFYYQADGGATLANAERYKDGTLQAQTGIMKNASLNNFQFVMILSSDHVTPAESKTIISTISKDGGAFASCANSASHISGGAYKINLTQAEMNADIITLKFAATDCDTRFITIKTSS